ncbi:MAG TPA: hypothetical protein VIH78_17700 [Terriglobales bacterium]
MIASFAIPNPTGNKSQFHLGRPISKPLPLTLVLKEYRVVGDKSYSPTDNCPGAEHRREDASTL